MWTIIYSVRIKGTLRAIRLFTRVTRKHLYVVVLVLGTVITRYASRHVMLRSVT